MKNPLDGKLLALATLFALNAPAFAQAENIKVSCGENYAVLPSPNGGHDPVYVDIGKQIKFEKTAEGWTMSRGTIAEPYAEPVWEPKEKLDSCELRYSRIETNPVFNELKSLICEQDQSAVDGPVVKMKLAPSQTREYKTELTSVITINLFGTEEERVESEFFYGCGVKIQN